MCWCRPNIRTPDCGRPECHPPTVVPARHVGLPQDKLDGLAALASAAIGVPGRILRIVSPGFYTPEWEELRTVCVVDDGEVVIGGAIQALARRVDGRDTFMKLSIGRHTSGAAVSEDGLVRVVYLHDPRPGGQSSLTFSVIARKR